MCAGDRVIRRKDRRLRRPVCQEIDRTGLGLTSIKTMVDSSKANQREMGEISEGVGLSCSHGLATKQLEREPNVGP